jgi:hypothetical protein
MRRVLIILTRPPDPLLSELISAQATLPDHQVEEVDLQATADYDLVLDKIFQADTIQVF